VLSWRDLGPKEAVFPSKPSFGSWWLPKLLVMMLSWRDSELKEVVFPTQTLI